MGGRKRVLLGAPGVTNRHGVMVNKEGRRVGMLLLVR